jgi:flagellar biosynthesis/type III secretory pathway protein FliH
MHRKEGRKEGWREGRKEGRKEGRNTLKLTHIGIILCGQGV